MQILSTEELETALKGGFSRLREVYADRVMLDIAQTPKKIIIQVHKKHLKTAKSVFRGEEFFYLHTLCAMPVCKCCATDKSHESSAPILNVLVPGYVPHTLYFPRNDL
jgi:hypothetical protein